MRISDWSSDVGSSDLARASAKVRVVWTFPEASHPPISYPVARLTTSTSGDAEGFRRFLVLDAGKAIRSEEHTSELQSLMRISYAVFCLKKKKKRCTTCVQRTDNE